MIFVLVKQNGESALAYKNFNIIICFILCELATMSPFGWHPPHLVDNTDTLSEGLALTRDKSFLRKRAQNGPKSGFFQFTGKLIFTYWIWSLMEIYIIGCVPTQIPYLEKFLFLRYGPKCSQPIRLQYFLINHISRRNQWNSLDFCMLIQIYIN